MDEWEADIIYTANDDDDIIAEILHNGEEVAAIKRGETGVEIQWYAHKKDLSVPFNWLMELLEEAKERLHENG